MGKKKKDKIQVHFIGNNCSSVTGSEILITFRDKKILLESGLVQSHSMKADYISNSKKYKFKPKDITVCFANHIHIDHIGRIPKLYAEGCEAPIITSHESVPFFQPMLIDSAHIMERDCEIMSKYGKHYNPIYNGDDVRKTLGYIRGYDYYTIHKFDDDIEFQLIPSGHIIGSYQLVLFLKESSGHKIKLLYTSDLGNIQFEQKFVKPFEPVVKAQYVIGEATYSSPDKKTASKNSRQKDIEKIKTVIENTCYHDRGRVLFPVFSLQRTQVILTMLYEIFKDDKDFDIPVYLDSPLAVRLTRIFEEVLTGEDKLSLQKVLAWKNLIIVKDPKASRRLVTDKSPKVVLSASGMGNAGRSRFYLKEMIPSKRDHIIFTGFAVEGSLSAKIKNKRYQKYISIDGKGYVNKAGITNITSFSGHMSHNDLIKYYTNINTSKIFLVHSEMDSKIQFKKILEEEFSKKNKTVKVIATNKDTVATL